MKRFITLILTLSISFSASAWGPKGHDVVASVAENHLSKRALKRITKVLDGKSMVYVANWMDNASHTPEYAYTKTWHYVNVEPSEGSYAESQREPKGDVVTAVNSIVERLKSGELTKEEERAELMMLIHLVGDLHCPMHAGHKSDRGGNGTQVKFFGKSKKLHSVWDSEIVESAHKWSYTEWQRQIDRLSRKECRAVVQGTPNDWVEECVAIADDIYRNSTTGDNLSYDYVAQYTPVVEQQLLKGGLRLAALLEEIY
ncbi:MAG: S1/P1 nuclease [Alistipes sp.]|nr:S1/P1 nuclease [Alistipes sp.]